jgi:basic amino acid/polyamine antiporter, APA family
MTGSAFWKNISDNDVAAPVVYVLKLYKMTWVRAGVLFGAIMGMISSLLVFQIGQARVWFAMSRDGLLPKVLGRVHPKFRTPDVATWVAGFAVGIPAGLLDIGTLADLSNIGTLFAFALVALGVIVLRYKDPERARGFRVPGGIAIPVMATLMCLLLMAGLTITNWARFFVWLLIGLVIYITYSRKHSEFAVKA